MCAGWEFADAYFMEAAFAASDAIRQCIEWLLIIVMIIFNDYGLFQCIDEWLRVSGCGAVLSMYQTALHS